VTDQRDDKVFEEFLAGESELTGRYAELGHEEPPPKLDTHILAEARKAAKIYRTEFGPRGGWLKPVALAATVLLSFSLVMKIVVEMPTRFEQVVTEASDSAAGPDSESSAEKSQVMKAEREMRRPSSVTAGEDMKFSVQEMYELRSSPLTDMPVKALMPESVIESRAQVIDRDAALMVIAEYFTANNSGRGDVDEMASSFAQKAEYDSFKESISAPSDRIVLSQQKSLPDEDVSDDPESILREIQRLYVGGADTEAGALLDEFLTRYPDHPVSVNIRQQGY
jgi:hypothetical protein